MIPRRPHHLPARAKPRVARYFACTLLVLGANAAFAQQVAQGPVLTEKEVVERATGRAPLKDVVEGAVVAEQGRSHVAGAYPNPQLSYMREQTFGNSGTGEDYLTIAQTIDLGNRRGLSREAGATRARAARSDGDATRLSIAADARERFYEVLYRQIRVTALESFTAKVSDALSIITRREQRGDVAMYDRRRLDRERSVAVGRLASERAALEHAQARLQALLGGSTSPVIVSGVLLPEADPAAFDTLRASATSRPDLRAAELQLDAASRDRTAASRWWLPDLRLEGGWKGIALGEGRHIGGFLLGASLSLPLWDQSSGSARIAEGEALAARGRRALLESELEGELGGARAEAVRLRRSATEFREQTSTVSADLVRMTSVGYEGGELGVLEMLDAYRGAADDELMCLDMELAARRARIELDLLSGAVIP